MRAVKHRSYSRIGQFLAAFLIVKIMKPILDDIFKAYSEDGEELDENGNPLPKPETWRDLDNAAALTNPTVFQEEWARLSLEESQLQAELYKLQHQKPEPKAAPVFKLSSVGVDINAKVLKQKEDLDPAEQMMLGMPRGPGSIEELYNNVEINIKDRTLRILNRTVYVKEAIPRGFWNKDSKTENNKPRMTVVLYHDREKPDEETHRFAFACCSEMWYKMNTIQNIAQHGHRVVAVDLPGYGESSKVRDDE